MEEQTKREESITVGKRKERKKIEDKDGLYSLLKWYVDYTLNLAYRRLEYVGREKIPLDGAVIYAPNHTNALMDALVVLAVTRERKVFIARADIFKKQLLEKILTFLKIMPINRIRDGWSNLGKTNETIEKASDVLAAKVPLCILPEGAHNAKHSLLPIGKGIFRIALSAHERIGGEMPLYIIPVGIEYGNFFRYNTTALVRVGDPVDVGAFIRSHEDMESPELMNAMRDNLTERMKNLILYIPEDELYTATWNLAAILFDERGVEGLQEKFDRNSKIISSILQLREERPEAIVGILEKAERFGEARLKRGVSFSSVTKRNLFFSFVLRSVVSVVTLPYFAIASVQSALVFGLFAYIESFNNDRAFYNSIRYVVILFFWPVSLLIWGILYFIFLPWEYALATLLLTVPAVVLVQKMWRNMRLMVSDLKLLCATGLREMMCDVREEWRNLHN